MYGDLSSKKTEKTLQIIFIVFFLIIFRVWHLTVIQKETLKKKAIIPQRKTIIEHAQRGTIRDRFGQPLALNQIRYNAAIYYAHIRQIPSIKWEIKASGEKKKCFARRRHIEKLSQLLAKELDLDPIYIEDQIHAKASLLPHTPFVIKENITEQQYYRLRMLEKEWLGLHAELTSERYYPFEKMGGDILGYLGRINQSEYLSIAKEIHRLEKYKQQLEVHQNPLLLTGYSSPDEALQRRKDLKQHAYSINDLIGKCGIENIFEEDLRGYYGKKIYGIDIYGNITHELKTSCHARPGKQIRLSLSADLQLFCEKLLSEDEKIRDRSSRCYDYQLKKSKTQKQPWIKGGSIIAIDPLNGEVVAFASYPRFNPNDFIPSTHPSIRKEKMNQVHKWLETPRHIADIWDNKLPLTRELYSFVKNRFYEEKKILSFPLFLDFILPDDRSLHQCFDKIVTIKNAIILQESIEELKYLFKQDEASLIFDYLFPTSDGHILCDQPARLLSKKFLLDKNFANNTDQILRIKKSILSFLSSAKHNKDKLFIIDLCRTVVFSPAFSDSLINHFGHMSLDNYWQLSKDFICLEDAIQNLSMPIFRNHDFARWRHDNQKAYIQKKRTKEKKEKKFAHPYSDYIYSKERKLFLKFWQIHRLSLLTFAIKNFDEFAWPHLHRYMVAINKQLLSSIQEKIDHLQKVFSSYPSDIWIDFSRTVRRHKDLDRSLLTFYPRLRKEHNQQTEKHLASSFYPINGFGYGRSCAYRDTSPLGSIFKLFTGYTALKQKYLDCSTYTSISPNHLNPLKIIDTVQADNRPNKKRSIIVGYNVQTKKPYPRFYKGGRLPRSSSTHIGEVDFFQAIEQSSNPYFALLTTDVIKHPHDLLQTAKEFGFGKKTHIDLPAEFPGQLPNDLTTNQTGLYSFAIGQHSFVSTPLQVAMALCTIANGGYSLQPKILFDQKTTIQGTLLMPTPIRHMLLEAMHRVVTGKKGTARPQIIHKLSNNEKRRENYLSLLQNFVGKTSTSEFINKYDMNPSARGEKYKNIWFGAISFENDHSIYDLAKTKPFLAKKPELVVIVYLKYGDTGKEAAPLATEVINKFREIKKTHQNLRCKVSSNKPLSLDNN